MIKSPVGSVKVSRLSLDELAGWIAALHAALPAEDWMIAEPIVADMHERIRRLVGVGLGYLALERLAPSLSAGEAQRLRLAALLGSGLTGVLYVLDEPTIGLHPRDNGVLLDTLERLTAKGNSLLVVEHDEDTIRRADHVIDLGPGAGTRGGRVVAAGTARQLERSKDSITGRLLAHPLRHPIGLRRGCDARRTLVDAQVEGRISDDNYIR